jgi:hypothetical protein
VRIGGRVYDLCNGIYTQKFISAKSDGFLKSEGKQHSGKMDKGGLKKAPLTEVLIGCGVPGVNT